MTVLGEAPLDMACGANQTCGGRAVDKARRRASGVATAGLPAARLPSYSYRRTIFEKTCGKYSRSQIASNSPISASPPPLSVV